MKAFETKTLHRIEDRFRIRLQSSSSHLCIPPSLQFLNGEPQLRPFYGRPWRSAPERRTYPFSPLSRYRFSHSISLLPPPSLPPASCSSPFLHHSCHPQSSLVCALLFMETIWLAKWPRIRVWGSSEGRRLETKREVRKDEVGTNLWDLFGSRNSNDRAVWWGLVRKIMAGYFVWKGGIIKLKAFTSVKIDCESVAFDFLKSRMYVEIVIGIWQGPA